MATLEGVLKAYSWEYKDKNRNRHGGRITQQEFWDLESGKYGEVYIIDFDMYCLRYEFPFIQILNSSLARTDTLLKARLGPRAEEYIIAHTEYARAWHKEQVARYPGLPGDMGHYAEMKKFHQGSAEGILDPYILHVSDAANCCYPSILEEEVPSCEVEKGYAMAHLISTSGLSHTNHNGKDSIVLRVSCHEWTDGVRLVGIKDKNTDQLSLHPGPSAFELLRKYWQELFIQVSSSKIRGTGFCSLVQMSGQWFTQYPKTGEVLDTGEPEYLVTSIKKIGEPVLFRTETKGYYGFFKYSIQDVKTLAPQDGNAYEIVSSPVNEGQHQTCLVQFYMIKADKTKRLMRSKDLARNYEKLMELVIKSDQPDILMIEKKEEK